MKSAPEKFRIVGDASYGNNGVFFFPHPKIVEYFFFCIISDGMNWEDVSVTIRKGKGGEAVERCPTWAEMCWVKDQFFDEEETVVQFHPPKSEHVSTHPYCLHLWCPTNFEMPRPLPEMVGVKGDNNQTLK